MTLIIPEGDLVAVVRVERGAWIADCPRPFCTAAQHLGPAPISGTVGGLFEPADGGTVGSFRCLTCTWEGPSQWPTQDERRAIQHVLSLRPVPATRNWLPGELVRDLVAENVAHGVQSVREPEVSR